MSQEYEVSIIKKKIPKDLWQKVKGAAMYQGKTLGQWLVEAVRAKLKAEGFTDK